MPVRTYPQLAAAQERLYRRRNKPDATWHNGLYERFADPILTREHIPVAWRYDADPASNPFAIERLGVGGVYNAGAIELDGRIALVARVEGVDRKSFFAVAESRNGIDGFRFRPEPVILPETDRPDVNVYDMRLTRHQDGWIYGLFCSERKDAKAAKGDLSSAEAQCGIARTRDLTAWERLPDLRTPSPQQRNVVLHPEFVNGKYLLYTRPQDGFIDAGSGGGIGWGLVDDMTEARIAKEQVFEHRAYHTIKEVKNGQGPHPIRTPQGWLHVAHGVRGCAAGLRYVLYAFMTELEQPWKVIAAPGGHLIAPLGGERVGDVSNVVFSNGMVARADGTLLIYYASSDTRMHVARTTVAKMVDYCLNTPADGLRSAVCVQQRLDLIRRNQAVLGRKAKATPVAKAKARAAGARG